MQDARALVAAPDAESGQPTAVAIGIAKLAEPAFVLHAALTSSGGGGGYIGTGRALSAAAGRLSYFYGLRVRFSLPSVRPSERQDARLHGDAAIVVNTCWIHKFASVSQTAAMKAAAPTCRPHQTPTGRVCDV